MFVPVRVFQYPVFLFSDFCKEWSVLPVFTFCRRGCMIMVPSSSKMKGNPFFPYFQPIKDIPQLVKVLS